MQSVARLDERAPDYHQALGELSGAIQRMALLQALPDLPPGEDEEEDAALAALARSSRPKTCSSCTRSRSRRGATSTTRPTRAAGFEMALLRMLAFRPQPVSQQRRAGRGPERRLAWHRGARARRSSRGLRVPAAESRAGRASRRRCAPRAGLRTTGRRSIDSARAAGPVRQLGGALRAGRAQAGDVVRLRLDAAGEPFRRPQTRAEARAALSQSLRRTGAARDSCRSGVRDGRCEPLTRRAARGARGRRAAARRRAGDRQRSGRARDARSVRRDGAAGLRQAAQLITLQHGAMTRHPDSSRRGDA